MKLSLLLLLLLTTIKVQTIYDPSTHTPGPNLVSHPLFDMPDISPQLWTFPSGSIPGWNCTNNCQINSVSGACAFYGHTYTHTWNQAVDLNSLGTFDNVSQIINIQKDGLYLVHLEWLPALMTPLGKKFMIKINSTSWVNITTNSTDYYFHPEEFLLNATMGQMHFQLEMFGTP